MNKKRTHTHIDIEWASLALVLSAAALALLTGVVL